MSKDPLSEKGNKVIRAAVDTLGSTHSWWVPLAFAGIVVGLFVSPALFVYSTIVLAILAAAYFSVCPWE